MINWLFTEEGDLRMGRALLGIAIFAFFACALTTALTGISWGGKVILAPFIGQGDTRIKVESSDNRIAAQKKFVSLYADVQKYQSMAAAADKDIIDYNAETEGKADPSGAITAEKGRLKQIKTGIQNTCRLAVANYNAAAVSVTEAQFRPENLPASIALASCEVSK
jgi:hypothetical protein